MAEYEEHMVHVREAEKEFREKHPYLRMKLWKGNEKSEEALAPGECEGEMETGANKRKRVESAPRVVYHFVRHGQGYHNVHGSDWKAAGKEGNPYTDPSCPVDPELTEVGRGQAKEAGVQLAELFKKYDEANGNRGYKVQVISSSLRRALETARLATDGMDVEGLIFALLLDTYIMFVGVSVSVFLDKSDESAP